MIVLPAVDIQNGRCVRLQQGRPDTATVYFERPCEAARHWENLGADALHVVDLDGAISGDSGNFQSIRQLLETVEIPVELGGGLRSEESVRKALAAGVSRAVVGTRAAAEPDWALELCDKRGERVIIAIDARDGRVSIHGWQDQTETSVFELVGILEEHPPAAFLYTDIERDGMLTRPNFENVERLVATTNVPVIASGGVSSIDDIRRIGQCGADAVITGKALYEKRFELPEALEAAGHFSSRLPLRPEESGAEAAR
jgi:phosphoribosylformimino-5-aminoimidazole carboxamide ribotide isomerase